MGDLNPYGSSYSIRYDSSFLITRDRLMVIETASTVTTTA